MFVRPLLLPEVMFVYPHFSEQLSSRKAPSVWTADPQGPLFDWRRKRTQQQSTGWDSYELINKLKVNSLAVVKWSEDGLKSTLLCWGRKPSRLITVAPPIVMFPQSPQAPSSSNAMWWRRPKAKHCSSWSRRHVPFLCISPANDDNDNVDVHRRNGYSVFFCCYCRCCNIIVSYGISYIFSPNSSG